MNVRFAAFLAAVAVAASSADALSSPDSLPHPVPSKVPTIHPGVHRALRTDGKVDLILELTQTTESTLENIKESAFSSREAKLLAVTDKLQTQNKVAAAEVTKLLSQEAGGLHEGFKNFWISNVVFVSGASFDLVEKLAGLASVGNIREQVAIKIDDPEVVDDGKELVGQEWGVKIIGAQKVWADGNIGQGVVVASLDTGVRGSHEAIKRNFRGPYGWYDPLNKSTEPNDPSGHGTHTMGTIAGSHGIGVAPGATWMSCLMALDSDGYIVESTIVDCAQWLICPTDTQGNNPDCTKAPHVVNNSWGSPGGENWFKSAVDAWVKAGIIPVFSAGNSGRDGCSTAGSPGDYPNVIGVGSTTSTDLLSPFSGKGPTILGGRRKPDISAPGSLIRSSLRTGDSDYGLKSGTSMAAPHVTGAIALILSAQPDLAIDEVKIALYTTTDQTGLPYSNYTCGATSDKAWPNNQYGHGRLNVLNAYEGFRPAP